MPKTTVSSRATARDAAQIAAAYLETLGVEAKDIRLEEVELSNDNRHWLITLSFDLYVATGFARPRQYKIFKIETSTRQVVSMKIRKVNE